MGIELWRVTQETRKLLRRITGRSLSKSFEQDLRILTPLLARVYGLQPEAVETLTYDKLWMYLEDLEAELEKRNLQNWAKGENENRLGRRKGRPGRKADPKIAERDQKILKAFEAGDSVDQVCKRFGISAGNARRIKSEGRKHTRRRKS